MHSHAFPQPAPSPFAHLYGESATLSAIPDQLVLSVESIIKSSNRESAGLMTTIFKSAVVIYV